MRRTAVLLGVLLAALVLAGCQGLTSRKPPIEVFPDMDRQPKYKAQAASPLFADGRANRMPVPGTVAQGQLYEDEGYHTGVQGGMYIGRNPLPLDRKTLSHGQERYNIYCAPCHDRAGTGRGIVGAKSLWLANSLHDDRSKAMADGELFHVISYGRRSMPGYRFQAAAEDRWAIVAYVRALQRATSGRLEDVPEDLKRELR